MLISKNKCRRVHCFFDSQPARQPLDELRFARAKFSLHRDNITGRKQTRQVRAQPLSFGGAVTDEVEHVAGQRGGRGWGLWIHQATLLYND